MKPIAAALLLAAVAAPALPGAALAQIAGPTPGQIVAQQQINQNQFQAQLQAEQLGRLQQQNAVALQQPGPGAQLQAMVQRQQIQQQIDQTMALQQQMNSPQSNPADINARLQQNNVQIQQLQQAPMPPPIP